MNNLVSALGLVIVVLFFTACKEVGPQINLHGAASASDSTYVESPVATPQQKNAVIEEFTGTSCPNCPQGHTILAGIQAAYPVGQIVPVAFHPRNNLGAPAIPSPSSLSIDLEDQVSTNLWGYLGDPGFEPAGDIDRILYTSQTSILIDRSYWQTYAAQELAVVPPLSLFLTFSYDSSNRQLNVITTIHFIDSISDPTYITILLTEDSITAPQVNGPVIDTYYVHNNVMRTILTGTEGDNVVYNPNANITLQAGRVIRLVYPTMLNASWNPHHMHIAAYVHDNTVSKIYQGQIMPLIN